MKKLVVLILGVMVSASMAFASDSEGKSTIYEIDTKESKVVWTGSKITGSSHTGHISIDNGTMDVQGKTITGGNLNIDMNSIVVTDIEDEKSNNKLVGHLKNDDFFSVDKYPNASFQISSIEKTDVSEYKVVGKLTMKGKTGEISFPAKINISGGKITAYGTAQVDRTKWGIRYGSGSFFDGLGDRAIRDNFEIKFELSAKESSSTASAK